MHFMRLIIRFDKENAKSIYSTELPMIDYSWEKKKKN